MARLYGLRPRSTASRHWDLGLDPAKRCFVASAPISRAIYGMVFIPNRSGSGRAKVAECPKKLYNGQNLALERQLHMNWNKSAQIRGRL